MHTRFGPTKHELESYYYLVLNYRDVNNKEKAEEYSAKLIRKYPESSYAKILSDPDYIASLNKEASKIDTYYEETYKLDVYKRQTVVFKSMFIQPVFCNLPVFFCSRGKKSDDMSFIKPFIANV